MGQAVVDQLKDRIREHALALVQRAADLAVTDTQAHMSRRTGASADSVTHTQPALQEPYVVCEISVGEPSARWQDEGTGIYGPENRRITPSRPGGVLVFDWPAAGGVVFARSVAGSPGKHFFTEPMPARWASCLAASAGAP